VAVGEIHEDFIGALWRLGNVINNSGITSETKGFEMKLSELRSKVRRLLLKFKRVKRKLRATNNLAKDVEVRNGAYNRKESK